MKWSLQELTKKKSVEFAETHLDLAKELITREPEILAVSEVLVNGRVDADKEIYVLNYTADYTLTLPSSRSLTPVEVPMSLAVSELFTTQAYLDDNKADLDADMLFILEKDVIDLDESVADNILLELPMKVLTKDEENASEMPKGDTWQVLTEEDYAKLQAESDEETKVAKSPFSQLDGLFD
ncbi:YceD family protein [Lactococcus insecticola]|uniref:DNA-binding protein n=1 Tax=Pseudolactococcus insecticola TaxID=2709158 RepID=A0A6A0B5L5_9LACT|nr:YceD family protein [Lactococcus insecticola]GFH40680.1 hypothetical protein Hs20B_10780 [Lactococcus insecticola]